MIIVLTFTPCKNTNNSQMKNIIIAAVIAIALGACGSSTESGEANKQETKIQSADSSQVFDLDTAKLKTGEAFYQCPMHLKEISDKPGACPECGMDLEKVVKL